MEEIEKRGEFEGELAIRACRKIQGILNLMTPYSGSLTCVVVPSLGLLGLRSESHDTQGRKTCRAGCS
jgi:hypothetical protein